MSSDRNDELAQLVGEHLGQVATGAADLVLALLAALKQQPGIDAEKLEADFGDAIPDRDDAAGEVHRLLKAQFKKQ